MATVYYCSADDIQTRLGELGFRTFGDNDDDGSHDSSVVNAARMEAKAEIDEACLFKYSEANLAASHIVNRWATNLSVWYMTTNRGNPGSAEFDAICQRIRAKLDKIAEGGKIPGIPISMKSVPTFTNLTVNRRYRGGHRVRKTEPSSSESGATAVND